MYTLSLYDMRYYIVSVYNETKFIKEDEKIIDDKTLKVYLSFLEKKCM